MLNILLSSVVVYSVFASSKGRFPLIQKENTYITVDDSTAVVRSKSPDELSGRYQYYKEQSKSPSEKLYFQKIESGLKPQMPLLGVWKRREPKTPPRYLLVFAHQSGSTSIPQRLMITSSYDIKFDTGRARTGPYAGKPPPEFQLSDQSSQMHASTSARESIQTPTEPNLDDAQSLNFASTVQSVHDQSGRGSEAERKSLGRGQDAQSEVSCDPHEHLKESQSVVHQESSSKYQVEKDLYHQEQLSTQWAIIMEMHGKTEKLQRALLSADEKNNRLNHVILSEELAIEKMNQQIRGLQQSQTAIESQNGKLRHELYEERQKVVVIQEARLSVEQDNIELQEKLANTNKIEKMSEQIKELHKSQDVIKKERDDLAETTKKEIHELSDQIDALEQSLETIIAERDNLKLTLRNEIEHRHTLREELLSAQEDKAELETVSDLRRSEIDTMMEQIKQLQQLQPSFKEERDQLAKEYTKLTDEMNQETKRLNVQIAELQQTVSSITKQRNEAREALLDNSKRHQDLHENLMEKVNGLESSLSHNEGERHNLLNSQRDHQEQIATCLTQRDGATAALIESKKECDQLRESVQAANERNSVLETERNNAVDEKWRSQMIWCCISVIFGTLLMVSILIFCIYHRRRLQAEKMEIYRLRRVNSINKKSQKDYVIIDTFRETNILDSDQEEDKEPESPKREEKKVSSANLKYGESLNDLVRNLDEVQGVLMEDIMDEMVTAGAEESENVEEQLREDSAGVDHAATAEVSEDCENTPMSLVVEQL